MRAYGFSVRPFSLYIRRMWKRLLIGLAIVAVGVAGGVWLLAPTVNVPAMAQALDFDDEDRLVQRLKVLPGYSLKLFATSVGRARVIRPTPGGNFIVTAARDGRVVFVRGDHDGDGRSDGAQPLIDGLARPHGLMVEDASVYIAESHRVARYQIKNEQEPGKAELVFEGTVLEDIPADGGHSTRTIGRGPDGKVYVSVGSSCNVCIEDHPWRSTILRLDGYNDVKVIGEGLRNSVGFDWQPGTGALYAVNAGRDMLGDDFPREEMNLIAEGRHYGWPFRNENNVADPDHGDDAPADVEFTPPAHMFTAHSTPLSIRFLRHQPDVEPGRAALVVRHGSWNRSRKSGYDIVMLTWQPDGTISEAPFITGFEVDEDVIGRPVDAFEMPDGSIYITDDFARAIYRVHRQN
jgi:glucose/arabinose dehydrogenase